MGDGARIEHTSFVGGIGMGYVGRPGMTRGADRFGYQALLGANFETFIDAHRSFRVIVAGTLGREEAFGASQESLTTAGGSVEAHFGFYGPVAYCGVGLNPRAVISDAGRPPQFELGVTARLSATFGYVGVVASVTGGLRLADMGRSSIEATLGAFLNLP